MYLEITWLKNSSKGIMSTLPDDELIFGDALYFYFNNVSKRLNSCSI